MVVLLPCFEFEMAAVEAVSLQRLAGWTLTAVNARVWLTEENGGRDVWLLAGDRHLIRTPGRVVVEAWLPAEAGGDLRAIIRLAPPAARVGSRWRLSWPWPGRAGLVRA